MTRQRSENLRKASCKLAVVTMCTLFVCLGFTYKRISLVKVVGDYGSCHLNLATCFSIGRVTLQDNQTFIYTAGSCLSKTTFRGKWSQHQNVLTLNRGIVGETVFANTKFKIDGDTLKLISESHSGFEAYYKIGR